MFGTPEPVFQYHAVAVCRRQHVFAFIVHPNQDGMNIHFIICTTIDSDAAATGLVQQAQNILLVECFTIRENAAGVFGVYDSAEIGTEASCHCHGSFKIDFMGHRTGG